MNLLAITLRVHVCRTLLTDVFDQTMKTTIGLLVKVPLQINYVYKKRIQASTHISR
jgi:hypothetical protein